jgi:hypothetical protein
LRFQPKLSEQEREEVEKASGERKNGRSQEEAKPVSEAQRKRGQGLPRVWTLTPEGFLRPISVRLGISDDQFTELIGDGLQEGQEVVTGMVDKEGGRGGASRSSNTSGPSGLRY